ncbi:hypothetical protein ACLK2F_04550 [Escherichia coli]
MGSEHASRTAEAGDSTGCGSWQAICDAARQIGMPEETLQAFCQQLAS